MYLIGFFNVFRDSVTERRSVFEPSVRSTTALSTVSIMGATVKAAMVPAADSRARRRKIEEFGAVDQRDGGESGV